MDSIDELQVLHQACLRDLIILEALPVPPSTCGRAEAIPACFGSRIFAGSNPVRATESSERGSARELIAPSRYLETALAPTG